MATRLMLGLIAACPVNIVDLATVVLLKVVGMEGGMLLVSHHPRLQGIDNLVSAVVQEPTHLLKTPHSEFTKERNSYTEHQF